MIYRKLEEIAESHDWSEQVKPRMLKVEPIDLMEKLKETKMVIEHLGV